MHRSFMHLLACWCVHFQWPTDHIGISRKRCSGHGSSLDLFDWIAPSRCSSTITYSVKVSQHGRSLLFLTLIVRAYERQWIYYQFWLVRERCPRKLSTVTTLRWRPQYRDWPGGQIREANRQNSSSVSGFRWAKKEIEEDKVVSKVFLGN